MDALNGAASLAFDLNLYHDSVSPSNLVNLGAGSADCADHNQPGFHSFFSFLSCVTRFARS